MYRQQKMSFYKLSVQLLAAVLLAVFSSVLMASTVVGKMKYVRGVLTAQHHGMGNRIMGRSALVYEEDTLTTGRRSFAIVLMNDGTQITIRPESSLGIEKYIARRGRNDSAILNLFKGGIRAITGFISKKRDDAYKIRTPVATIGIRGTEFDARLCSQDCEQNKNKSGKKTGFDMQFVIARVAFLRGQLSATDKHKKTRQVFVGGPLYEGETLKTGSSSFAVLAFKDKSRITLNTDTVFEIKKHHYVKDKPETSSALMELFRGGLRAVSGLIGRKNKKAYQMRTPVATIGIRGTGYDIQCEGDCVNAAVNAYVSPLEKIFSLAIKNAHAALDGDGMYAHVWDGAIELKNEASSKMLDKTQVAFLKNSTSEPVILRSVPFFMQANPAPRPDKVKIEKTLFEVKTLEKVTPGLYVSVYDGHVSMTDQKGDRIDLGKGEAAYSNNQHRKQNAPVRLGGIPSFMAQDVYPRPEAFNEAWESLFNKVTNPDENQDLECTAK